MLLVPWSSSSTKCMACHSKSTKLAGLDLQSDRNTALVGARSTQWPSEHRVVAGDVEQSLLYKKLIGTQGTHGARMPLMGELDAQSTDAVAEWIRSGAHRCKR